MDETDATRQALSRDGGPQPCDVCGGATIERHCKVICQRCGYTRDCSDP